MRCFVFALLISFGLTACATTVHPDWAKPQTVGKVPCMSDQIEIGRSKMGAFGGPSEWVAICNGVEYACSWVPSGMTRNILLGAVPTGTTTCSPMKSASPATSSAPATPAG